MKSFTNLFRPKLLLAGALLAVVSVFGANTLTNNKAAAICNDIVCGGVSNAQQAVNAYNNDGRIQALYNDPFFGNLGANNGASRFGGQAVEAKTYIDGRTVLNDGRVVITGGYSAGNTGGPNTFNPYTINIGGNTFYWGFHYSSFGSDGLRTLVLMDEQNKYAQFAILTDCANPVYGEIPHYQCDALKSEKTGDDTFKFWTDVSLKNTENTSASVQNVHYDFGDGETADNASASTKVPHTYKKPGNYKVKVTVTYTVNGVVTQETLQINCQKDVEVKEKKVVAKCDKLEPFLIDGTRKYNFVGTASVENAKVTGATFKFGDNSTAPGKIGDAKDGKVLITAEHQYAKDLTGKIKIDLELTFDAKDSTTGTCQTEITFTEETCKDNPNRPECQPKYCKPEQKIPEGDERCKEILPKEIVATGPAEIIGSAIGLGGLTGAGMYWRASRKNLHDLFKK